MNKSQKLLNTLQSSCGSTARRTCIEVYFSSGEVRGEIISVGIELENGVAVKLGCAGDGTVSMQEGQCRNFRLPDGDEIQPRELHELADVVLEECRTSDSKLYLRFSSGVLEIENADDELEVRFDNQPVSEELLTRSE